MMEPSVEIALIGMVGSVLSAVCAAAAVYLGTVNRAKLNSVETKVDGQLTETVELKKAVAFGKGEDKQRDKQELKEAVKAGIKEANGETLH
jgi:hypothetical protein